MWEFHTGCMGLYEDIRGFQSSGSLTLGLERVEGYIPNNGKSNGKWRWRNLGSKFCCTGSLLGVRITRIIAYWGVCRGSYLWKAPSGGIPVCNYNRRMEEQRKGNLLDRLLSEFRGCKKVPRLLQCHW